VGTIWAWGDNRHGQLMVRDQEKNAVVNRPKKVQLPEDYFRDPHAEGEPLTAKKDTFIVVNNDSGVTVY